MRTALFITALAAASIGATAAAAGEARGFLLKPVNGGGYAIERNSGPDAPQTAHGIATIADLIPLLERDAGAPEKIDFTAGEKLEGVFTVMVGREDGTLGKYEGANDVIVFAAPASRSTRGDLTTLSGAVVFSLKIDNAGAPVAVQRLETGTITLTRARKSL